MDGDSITIYVIILAVLVALSAYFSASETAFLSLNRIRIKNLAEDGNKRARLVLRLYDNYDKVLSTILVGNNIVNIAAASIATVFFVGLMKDDNTGPAVATVVMTVALLIFGEISPKTIAKEKADGFAMATAPVLNAIVFVLTPINFIFSLWKKLLSLVFKFSDDDAITEEELLTIVEEAESEGGIDSEESELIRSAIEFSDLEASDILTPRVDVVAVSTEDSQERISRTFVETGFSRLPVYENTIDHIIGVIHQKDLYIMQANGGGEISSIMKPAIFAHESIKLSVLLKTLQKSKSHIAVIADDYGGTIGIVTLEDIIEEIVGEIWDEHDDIVEDFVRMSDDRHRILCSANLNQMFEYFEMKDESDTPNVGGWVWEQLEKVPEVGDTFEYGILEVTVSKVDPIYKRAEEIIVTVHEKEQDEEE
ncbi:MAG: HlyC/CorC family transporter [Clostridia bacterium]|nr:HlyC/CorC family transporter [Clostridia bacterium]